MEVGDPERLPGKAVPAGCSGYLSMDVINIDQKQLGKNGGFWFIHPRYM